MSQTDMNVDNDSGAAVRIDINGHLAAISTVNSGSTAPPAIFPNMWWYDTSNNVLKQRNNANTVWLPLWRRNPNGWQVLLTKGADIASGTTLVLGNDGNYFDVTGSITIQSISPINQGTSIKLHFDQSLTLTHHLTNLVLPGATNITTQAGDEAEFVEYLPSSWRCVNYQRNVSP